MSWVTALILAEHEVLVDILAMLADEEAGRLQRRRRDTEFVNVWLARRHRSRVDVGFPWELGISVRGHLWTFATTWVRSGTSRMSNGQRDVS